MKLVIYLTKTKIWYGGKSIDWGGADLIKIFKDIRKDERVRDVRIVLGDDVSYVAAFVLEERQPREKIEEMTRGWLPFVLEKNCFDYRLISVGGQDWVQAVAVERSLLDAVSKAVWESGLNLELMIPIGALLAEKSNGYENPIMVKWNGYENLSVLAVNGLADSVFRDEDDLKINTYAKEKWNLENDLEILILEDSKFNLIEEAYKEKNRGEDVAVLSIPVLKKQEIVAEIVERQEVEGEVEASPKKTISKMTIFLIVVLVISLGIMGVVLYNFYNPSDQKVTGVNTPVPVVITPMATPSSAIEAKIDLSKYVVQVLNGSGVTGEAGRVRDLLIEKGFVSVDVGNAEATSDTLVSRKENVPQMVIDELKILMGEYIFDDIGLLTSNDKYDLVIVLGGNAN